MKEIVVAVLITYGISYIVAAGIVWIFELELEAWKLAFGIWGIWKLLEWLKPKRELTIQEQWERL